MFTFDALIPYEFMKGEFSCEIGDEKMGKDKRCEVCNSPMVIEYDEEDKSGTYVCSYCGLEHTEKGVDKNGLQDLSTLQ